KMNEFVSLAHQYGCTVIEDAAHAFPVTYNGKYIGTIGDIGVYSFYATKTITTGEGGMVVTASEKIAKRIKTMRLHGIDRDVWNRYTSKGATWYYEVLDAGFKYNLPDILSAIGRVQLKKANDFKTQRTAIAEAYNSAFSAIKGCLLPPGNSAEDHAWHLYSLRILHEAKLSRDELIEALTNAGIGTSVHFIPLHLMPFYAKTYHYKPDDFPNAVKHFNSVVSLPIWHGMNNNQVHRIIETIQTLLQ
ncbi:MAG TPA: DegT/DnrJ/EryC1/StrS family aminotransferase, partial [Spirochaetales bacterium]|nr:DegT/DnrJ/EryC1/StrS family aminotransferase [Spirochaetales bacterium]